MSLSLSWGNSHQILGKIIEELQGQKEITETVMAKLTIIFGTELIKKVFYLLFNAEFYLISSEENERICIKDNSSEKKERYYLDTSLICLCPTTRDLFTAGRPEICHHIIALEVAKKLGICKSGCTKSDLILNCSRKISTDFDDLIIKSKW